ncbi:MAG: [FeFe] hydrogenase H-cluster radical SAM maturase HydE [Victivallaceae bacterium]
MIKQIFAKIETDEELLPAEIKELLQLEDKAEIKTLFDLAYKIKLKYIGNKAYFRGIIECGNICMKDCYYCGIRRSNENVERFLMDRKEILREAVWAFENNYGSIVIQSGERSDATFINLIEQALLEIKDHTGGKLGITLSLGEQTPATYRRWFNAGAHRYLLRIETSNRELYRKLHPEDHSFDVRLNCLKSLREAGYQVGTGVMIGLPFQTIDNLVDDILFFKAMDIDMIGMGPYLVHSETPLAKEMPNFDSRREYQLELSLKMIAVARIYLKDINIAATTALQALKHDGRELGLLAGANVIMPNVTETEFRPNYQLYDNKPCMDENSSMCRGCLSGRIAKIGEVIGFDEWGDSPHFASRQQKKV